MLQRLRRSDTPRRIQDRHPAFQISEFRINKMPRGKRLPGLRRIKGARKLDEAPLEWILADLSQQALETIFLTE
ncbi:hypothetical protein V490_04765 [Pseudogymnoascus sp. VKM F-3557]|nr:hypothetical protein V490_04765 [Pseudogymnoascus sp. VKM F-3557]